MAESSRFVVVYEGRLAVEYFGKSCVAFQVINAPDSIQAARSVAPALDEEDFIERSLGVPYLKQYVTKKSVGSVIVFNLDSFLTTS